MTKFLLVMLATMGISAPAYAANVEVLQTIRLDYYEETGDYGLNLHFEKDKPGQISQELLAPGCTLALFSSRSAIPAGSYRITNDDTQSPSVWDRRWWRTILSGNNTFDVRVVCKAHSRISTRSINTMMRGYVRVR